MPEVLAKRRNEVADAEQHGMHLFDVTYSVPNFGLITVATKRERSSFSTDKEFATYIYENRHNQNMVRFINQEANHLYRANDIQDRIAKEIAERISIMAAPSTFREEGARAETVTMETINIQGEATRREEAVISEEISFLGRPIHVRLDVSGMDERERETLKASIERLKNTFNIEGSLASFIDRYKDRIDIDVEMRDLLSDKKYWYPLSLQENGEATVERIRQLVS